MGGSGLEHNRIVKPKHSPGSPPKDYHEKKAIGFFACLSYSFGCRCPELLRVRTALTEVYVIPFVEDKPSDGAKRADFHLSYHPSGEFHWTVSGAHIKPVYGEDDFRRAFEFWLIAKAPLCLCLRKGKRLSEQEILASVRCWSRYVPMLHDVEEASRGLKRRGFYRIVQPMGRLEHLLQPQVK